MKEDMYKIEPDIFNMHNLNPEIEPLLVRSWIFFNELSIDKKQVLTKKEKNKIKDWWQVQVLVAKLLGCKDLEVFVCENMCFENKCCSKLRNKGKCVRNWVDALYFTVSDKISFDPDENSY